MKQSHISEIAVELSLTAKQVTETVNLLDDGSTIPFISRYRKEATGNLDEVAVAAIRDGIARLRDLDKRREAILASLEKRGQLTNELKAKIESATSMIELEDIYLPYRPKRKTRASIAKERGLEPLAELLFAQGDIDPDVEAAAYINPEKDVESVEKALAGARDIIAEWVSENKEAREQIRHLYSKKGMFRSKLISDKEEIGSKYRDYFDWEESVASAPSHRILAMRRGENEKILTLRIVPPEEDAHFILERQFVKSLNLASQEVKIAVHDGFKRLLAPSIETEIRLETKKRADREAVSVFADNLRHLLLAPPAGSKNVMAVDPGFRTGCKVCCLDRQGNLVHNDVIHPLLTTAGAERAAATINDLCKRFDIELIAVGNGTAGRETESFIREHLTSKNIPVVMVNESGASIYSTSEAGREEFPEYDATVRGAVSIGRRLMDPLGELVKIDPKSIGVGQYQHDVDQGMIRDKLDDVVVSCVNSVGVEVNIASKQLLTYVSGVGKSIASKIVEYRTVKGPFQSRAELKKVPGLGAKAFVQAAGFLRIRDGKQPLDSSAVHPESYPIVKQMAKDLNSTVSTLMCDEALIKSIELTKYITDTVGLPTLTDIKSELAKPGRDPRDEFEIFSFSDSIQSMDDLTVGMVVPGIVTNVTAFGAFVDIGVHQDGLVHISELADRFVKQPSDVVAVQQQVKVKVLDVDVMRKRISLSIKQAGA